MTIPTPPRLSRLRRRLLIGCALVVAAVATAGVAVASIPASDDTYTACYRTSGSAKLSKKPAPKGRR